LPLGTRPVSVRPSARLGQSRPLSCSQQPFAWKCAITFCMLS
jgi:hypothetical protein